MSNNEIWRENGAVIPFPRPTRENGFAIDQPPFVCIKFNAEWLPYVMGALKILMRAETYETDGETANLDAREAMMLPALIVDCQEEDTNWYLESVGSHGVINTFLYPFSGPDSSRQWLFRCTPDGLEVADFTVRGFDRADTDLKVGGKVDWVVEGDPEGSVRAITLLITRCDDGVDTVTDFTPYGATGDEWKSIRVIAGNAITMSVTSYDNWTCGPA